MTWIVVALKLKVPETAQRQLVGHHKTQIGFAPFPQSPNAGHPQPANFQRICSKFHMTAESAPESLFAHQES